MHRRLATRLTAAIAIGVVWLGCEALGRRGTADDPVAARIGDDVITVSELAASIKDDLFKRETNNNNPSRTHDLRSQALRALISKRVLEQEAAKQGLTPDAMLEAEFAKLPPVTDAEVQAFYDKNAGQIGNMPLEQLSPRI